MHDKTYILIQIEKLKRLTKNKRMNKKQEEEEEDGMKYLQHHQARFRNRSKASQTLPGLGFQKHVRVDAKMSLWVRKEKRRNSIFWTYCKIFRGQRRVDPDLHLL